MNLNPAETRQKRRMKRKHDDVATDDTSPTLSPTRSEPWFDDGNIILEAGAKQFRVHRRVLAASSKIFADMFSAPQPAQGDEVVDGCPVVKMSDDAEELTRV